MSPATRPSLETGLRGLKLPAIRREYAALADQGRAEAWSHEEYLAALDKAVRAAVSGKEKPQAALDAAAAQWRTITEKLGVAGQRTACERSDVRIEH